ncbi:MAG: hypothetical protein RIQ81_2085 [Pseudomonadota bacterium]|jgi:hypothetical protein
MPRIALWNMFFGFLVVCIAAAAGPVIANELTNSFMTQLETGTAAGRDWMLTLQSSAHGHMNLFGILHVITGVTMPHARQSHRIRLIVTSGLSAGVVAMGPLMLWRSYLQPARNIDASGIAIGVCLVAALLALVTHAACLWQAFARRS